MCETYSPSRGRKPLLNFLAIGVIPSLENDSPSRGRKLDGCKTTGITTSLENDSPSRGRKLHC